VMGGGAGIYRRSGPMGTAPRRRRMDGRSTTVESARITSPALQADSLNNALWPQKERPPQASARVCPAPSPDVHYGHPALRSLRVRCATPSRLRLLPQPGSQGMGRPSLMPAELPGRPPPARDSPPSGWAAKRNARHAAAEGRAACLPRPRRAADRRLVEPPRRRSPAAATAARKAAARPAGRTLAATTPAQACGGHGWPRRREVSSD
jgi:hypothetical protein